MSNRNIFITGATGKIGQALIKGILEKDWQIKALILKGEEIFHDPKVSIISGDLLDPEGYAPKLKGVDTVLHMAAITHTNKVSRYYAVNSDATLKLIEACKAQGIKRFIYISTRAISEEEGDYSKSKAAAEKYVQQSGLDWVIIRPAEVYGSSGKEGVDMILNNIQKFPFVPIIGNGKYEIAPVYVEDVITSMINVIERRDVKNRIYNIAGPESFTYNQFIDRVLSLKHLRKIKVHIPVVVFRFLAQVAVFMFKDRFIVMDQLPRLFSGKSDDISLATRELSFNPSKLEDIIGEGE